MSCVANISFKNTIQITPEQYKLVGSLIDTSVQKHNHVSDPEYHLRLTINPYHEYQYDPYFVEIEPMIDDTLISNHRARKVEDHYYRFVNNMLQEVNSILNDVLHLEASFQS